MACNLNNSCAEECNNDCNGADAAPDIEDYKTKVKSLEEQNQTMKQLLKELGHDIQSEEAGKPLKRKFRSAQWFSRDTAESGLASLYADRYMNFGFTKEELTSGKPIIGIAQTGSDIAPCNRHHIQIAKRVKQGIIQAGGVPMEFPMHPIQESSRRPTATLDRNLAYLGVVEVLHSYPLDGVVLLTGCDKTTPALLMAAATVNLPSICLNVGPMLNGRRKGTLIGTGTIMWRARELKAEGAIDDDEFFDMVTAGSPSVGHCNTMGTASSMNAMAEALGMALPGSASIPAAYRERMQYAYRTGQQIVEMVHQDRKPSEILTRKAFENAIVTNTAIGGSSNCPIHLIAIARHMGVDLDMDDWDRLGFHIPLLVNVQPAGEMLCEDYYHAGSLPAVMAELLDANKLHPETLTCNGRTTGENVKGKHSWDRNTIRAYDKPMKKNAGFIHLKGTLFDSAIMKTSVISEQFRKAFLEDPEHPNSFTCRVRVFDGPEHYEETVDNDDSNPDDKVVLVMRGAGPIGYPGAPEVVNMRAPKKFLQAGVRSLPCIGDGRQSGTSGSPSILHVSPEAAIGGNLAILKDGDMVKFDLDKRGVDLLLSDEEIKSRRASIMTEKMKQLTVESHTPWQEIFRNEATQLNEGMVLKTAVKYQRIIDKHPQVRHNH
ncbi:dihydroxy-acid and 6-phosphogluconate dehydratase [Rhizodiscina lignyota]|uniref:Dihydroxy-acid and 6-phosphogluconate dehydratase n=1 Tax=Rhizodiscina lignyota TaxID=1504668 RepID=A0A9P4M2V2_9PEZI|nr:dihydroxy-acid and 6-phosphogluconate dehydratase [Rhizodiscina lignyota]